MLYEDVAAILDKCRDENLTDVMVAEDMLISENKLKHDNLRIAGDFLDRYYKQITKCNRLGDRETIKTLCELSEADKDKFNTLLREIEEREE